MDIKDLTGLGKATEKLLEVISKAIGTLYKPLATKFESKALLDAKVEEMKALTTAYVQAADIISQNDSILEQRAVSRIKTIELLRQNNIETIIQKTVSTLSNNPDFESHETNDVGQDWLFKFFESAKDISDKDIQKIWAEILARKSVKGRSHVSLMTLDSLRLLEPPNAILFEKIAKSIATFGVCFPFQWYKPAHTYYHQNSILSLQELGFIRSNEVSYPDEVEFYHVPFPGFSIKFIAANDRRTEYQKMNGYDLTVRGTELAEIILKTDKIRPTYAKSEFISLEVPDRFIAVQEQAEMIEYWLNSFYEYGGYKATINLTSTDGQNVEFEWKGKGAEYTIRNFEEIVPGNLKLLLKNT